MSNLVDDLIEIGFTLTQIKWALQDGSWLAISGISESEAEAAYADVKERLNNNQ